MRPTSQSAIIVSKRCSRVACRRRGLADAALDDRTAAVPLPTDCPFDTDTLEGMVADGLRPLATPTGEGGWP
jgi:hypothetical protein